MIHELKTDPEPFSDVFGGRKTFELRRDDRPFAVADILHLRETVSTGAEMSAGAALVYTGSEIVARVGHIMRGPLYGLAEGWVIISIGTVLKGTRPFNREMLANAHASAERYKAQKKRDAEKVAANRTNEPLVCAGSIDGDPPRLSPEPVAPMMVEIPRKPVPPTLETILPAIPVRIRFDPLKSEKILPVYRVTNAWKLWLLWKPRHVVNQYFDEECIEIGKTISDFNPCTIEGLRACFRFGLGTSNFHDADVIRFCREALPYFMDEKPVDYIIE